MTSVFATEDPGVAGPAVHHPVLAAEVTRLLVSRHDSVLVDATLGLGGHAAALLEALGPGGRVIGIDRDREALDLAVLRLAGFGESFFGLHGDHGRLRQLLADAGVFAVDGVLFDLGVSSLQLDDPGRGFSFRREGPLDMRMDPERGEPAAALLARAGEGELRDLLREFGEERRAAAIARAIVRRRAERPFESTLDLAELVAAVAGPAGQKYRIHPATRTFQALRIAVNREIVDLEATLLEAVSLLRRGGRIAVLSYHSLEDRVAKRTLRGLAHRCTCPPRLPACACGRENVVRVLTAKAIRPSVEEVRENPRARSAKLRVAERL